MPAAISSDRKQRLTVDGKEFLFQHGYRFGKVTYITRLPVSRSRVVWTPGHLTADEVRDVILGDDPWLLE